MIYNKEGKRWKVTVTKRTEKDLLELPEWVRSIYQSLASDLEQEGPFPKGWDSKPLKGSDEIRIRLNREYRVILIVDTPDLIVIKVAHRKEVYK